MLRNYLKVAIRNIARNKLYAVINILGLAMGLTLYIFGGLFYDYENSHDAFFSNAENIYTLESTLSSQDSQDGSTRNVVYAALAPIIKTELTEIEQIARTMIRSFLLTADEDSFYQSIHFADPGLLNIFEFNYIYGDASALDNSTGTVLTESLANKFFPGENPIGKTISINHEHDIIVSAVIKDLPQNSHFNSNFSSDRPLEIIIPLPMIERLENKIPDSDWGEMSSGHITYVTLPPHLSAEWLEAQLVGIYDRHFLEEKKRFVSGLGARSLISVNVAIWDRFGIPAIDIVKILGIFVLIIACLNYTNLATAQSMGRAREVGLRKTLGAGLGQLLTQFITESLTLTFIAMILALSALELIIPMFNLATGKILDLNYIATMPWLLMTTVTVGVLAGTYPAYLITKTSPIEALRDGARKGKSSAWVRGGMIGIQFSLSVFMLALVLVVYSQNKKVEQNLDLFPTPQIYTLDRIGIDQIESRHETLRNEMLRIDGVEKFTYSSQVPFEGFNNGFVASTVLNNISSGFRINQMVADFEFLNTYDIELVAGRSTNLEVSMDTHVRERGAVNAMINELAAQNFGFASAQDAIGEVFYEEGGPTGITTYTIVGVIEDQNIYGLAAPVFPFVYFTRGDSYRHASLKLSKDATPETIAAIEATWDRVIPDYPLQSSFLESRFEEQFKLFDLSTKSLATFAIFALSLALIGLFGLAAFMAEQRTKEIGIRKVLGATPPQVINLLIWQFSKPVAWAMPFSVGLAYLASDLYLEFFDDRIGLPLAFIIGAAIIGLILSWITVASHAYNVARANPINALHYE